MIYFIIPAYNESQIIGTTITSIAQVMKKIISRFLILVIDDGSSDNTVSKAKSFKNEIPIRVIQHKNNYGPGRAFNTGINYVCNLASKKDIIITLEADNTNDAKLIPFLIKKIKEGFEVVCASRYQKSGGYRNFPLNRTLLSLGANTIMRFLFPIDTLKDYTFFYRAYQAEVLKNATSHYGNNLIEYAGFVGNIEILIKLRKNNIKITSIPVIFEYKHRLGKSRMNIIRNIIDYFSFIKKSWLLRNHAENFSK